MKENAIDEYKDQTYIFLYLGVYEHKNWVTLVNMKNPTCEDRKNLAFQIDRARVPINGSIYEGRITFTERNWFKSMLYYVAVMDCEDELYKQIGENESMKFELTLKMTADDNHISYEKRGVVSENIYLIVIFVALIAFSCKNMTKFNLEFDLLVENTPTLYCMVAMTFQLLGLVLDLIHWSKYT